MSFFTTAEDCQNAIEHFEEARSRFYNKARRKDTPNKNCYNKRIQYFNERIKFYKDKKKRMELFD